MFLRREDCNGSTGTSGVTAWQRQMAAGSGRRDPEQTGSNYPKMHRISKPLSPLAVN